MLYAGCTRRCPWQCERHRNSHRNTTIAHMYLQLLDTPGLFMTVHRDHWTLVYNLVVAMQDVEIEPWSGSSTSRLSGRPIGWINESAVGHSRPVVMGTWWGGPKRVGSCIVECVCICCAPAFLALLNLKNNRLLKDPKFWPSHYISMGETIPQSLRVLLFLFCNVLRRTKPFWSFFKVWTCKSWICTTSVITRCTHKVFFY